MRYEVIVIGAGMVGTSIAWHLQKKNSKVLLLDKKSPGSETSYGNAGLIQREAIHIHPFPRQPIELLKVLPNKNTDIRYRWPAVLRYRQALLGYWRFSAPSSVQKIEKEWQTLIEHCTSEHQKMITAAGVEELIRRDGWVEMHRTDDKFKTAVAAAKNAREQGIEHQVLSLAELKALEPNGNFDGFIGAIHWLNSWQVSNPGELVKAYAKSFRDMHGTIGESSVKKILPDGDGWQVITDNNFFYSDHLVVAAGPWSSELIKPLGYDLPLFPMRGYHQHFEATDQNAINHSLVDVDNGFVMGPMQQGIRITTGAEMALMDAAKDFGQLHAVLGFAKNILPLNDQVENEPWCGSRPCMPDMKPVIGASGKHDNLWFAFGHGHQGFTLGPITGRIVEELIHNQPLTVDVEPFNAQRFSKS
ncbi:NAD(P)/FAD-dependent oxidoreductase [Neptunomonas antarctica]|uniref:D-amino-acid dehydrogenase n=1 Tax=Neptunomonas antarctica TaxID=619304 RepID=A0A1N7NVS0_9GAMM|nr:FAD-binding oxidoreductase [Neptunomonas antarctica]SIT02376.1 D-amino-acid dehydrogenase [Neptunomonas antarctica]